MRPQEITVAGVTSAVLTYRGERVCTTRQLAQFYGCSEKNITDNHGNNRERFEEGKHFIRIDGDELRAFKADIPDFVGDVPDRTARLMLWTEKGAARHAKALTTDKAWEVFEELEDRYFRATVARPDRHQVLSRNQVAAGILLLRSAAEDLKFAPSAVLGGYQRLEAQLGVTGLLPAYAVDAPTSAAGGSSEETKAAGDLLEQFGVGLSAMAFNRLLMQHGFLEEHERPSSKGGMKKFKVCTDLEYGKNLTNPNNPRETQPHWFVCKFAELVDLVVPAKATVATV